MSINLIVLAVVGLVLIVGAVPAGGSKEILNERKKLPETQAAVAERKKGLRMNTPNSFCTFIRRFAAILVIIVGLICFYSPQADSADQSDPFVMMIAFVVLAYGIWGRDQNEGSSEETDVSGIPNKANHFAPGFLMPGEINDSLVDPSSDPFDD